MPRDDSPLSPCTAFIGLGSNLLDPVQQVQRAFKALKKLPDSHFIARSSLYRSKALPLPGVTSAKQPKQPDFINAVAMIETKLSPTALLNALQTIEIQQGRQREKALRWGPRTIDLDIVFYGNQKIDTETLTLPHPEAHKRAFVVLPLLEVVLTAWLFKNSRRFAKCEMPEYPNPDLENAKQSEAFCL